MLRPVWRFLTIGLWLIAQLGLARAETFDFAPGQTSVGKLQSYAIKKGDTLLDVARAFHLGYTELVAANPGFDPWQPGTGRLIVLPTLHILPDGERAGIVINLATQRLFYFLGGSKVATYPIGSGEIARSTPLGATQVIRASDHPTWTPPPSIRAEHPELPDVVPPGPDNPMGDYALYLGWPRYAIHGTDKPFSIGRNLTHGCIRLYPEDIGQLFHDAPVGTRVRVIKDDLQVADIDGQLVLAMFPTMTQADDLDNGLIRKPVRTPNLHARVKAEAGKKAKLIVWGIVDAVAAERSGIPTMISLPSPTAPKAKRAGEALISSR
ncbi:MAG TPA: L,D-transpeptidase family protein [Alphaproteobacteria bacterium]|nr:L,D-transpeptidase family protein [Alphaproteobacteria bacterium]